MASARSLVGVAVLTLVLLIAPGFPQATAADATVTGLNLSAPASIRAGSNLPLTASLTATGAATPVAGAAITFDKEINGLWTPLGSGTTDGSGVASLNVVASGTSTKYRAVYAGDGTYAAAQSVPVQVAVVVVGSVIALTGPAVVLDEQYGTLRIVWSGTDGLPVVGSARLWQHRQGQAWQPGATLKTGTGGHASAVIRPRVDTWYQVRGQAGVGWEAAVSATLYVDNRPQAAPVVLPPGAPTPRLLPAQPRATAPGAAVTASRIPDAVWKGMVGRSWHAGCPVRRSGLRYLRTNYWGFDGYRHRGELVVRASAVGDFARAMRSLYRAKIPIRSMYLPDRFGYSKRSGGADDFLSMQFDNTSAFNCRWVTGNPGVRSPHSYGRSIDLNPWENPYHSNVGWLPNSWWAGHGAARYAWRYGSHPVVRIMRSSGFRWSYPRSDPQHFDA